MSKQRSDHGEFEEFARARTPQLYRSAWLLCGDGQQAEDLVQETLAKVWLKFRRIDHPVAYAQTTLTRTFISGRRRRSSTERPTADLPEVATDDATAGSDLRLTLLGALAGLAPADRAVLVLRYLDDLSVEDTAERMGVSEGAVRNRSLRALARVKPLLDDSLSIHSERGTTHD